MGKRPIKGTPGASVRSSGLPPPIMSNEEMIAIINRAVQERVDGAVQQRIDSLKKKLKEVFSTAGLGDFDQMIDDTATDSESRPTDNSDKMNMDQYHGPSTDVEPNRRPLHAKDWGIYDDYYRYQSEHDPHNHRCIVNMKHLCIVHFFCE